MKSLNLNQSGFTLLEMLISLSIALVILTALSATFLLQHKIYDVQGQITVMVQSARNALELISRELKTATYDPSCAGIGCMPYSDNGAQLEIRADFDGDSELSGNNEKIIYTFNASEYYVNRDTGDGAKPFFQNIQQFKVEYFDQNGKVMTIKAPFILSRYAFSELEEGCLPATISKDLKKIDNHEYSSEDSFTKALEETIGKEDTEKYGCLIKQHSRILIKLTEAAIADLKEKGLPESVIQALEEIRDREYKSSGLLAADLKKSIGKDNWEKYGGTILNAAVTYLSSQIRQIRIIITARTDKSDPDYNFNQGHRMITLTVQITPYNLIP
ncbi:prepilin-type N-terminal cleavage/methylation domain-containing protein [Desulfococcaceae bacterium HSG9]|nr:prepilin-type N-terminal cleavage/methylation domain-containing protein [Desulfococcaceae bacterium HSG9]